MKLKSKLTLAVSAILLTAGIASADVIEIYDCDGKEKLAVAKTADNGMGNIVINLTDTKQGGVAATLSGMDNEMTKSTISVSGMMKFNDVKAGQYKLCSGDGPLAFDSINVSGTGVAQGEAGVGAGLAGAGAGGGLGTGLGIAGGVAAGAGAGAAAGLGSGNSKNPNRNPSEFGNGDTNSTNFD